MGFAEILIYLALRTQIPEISFQQQQEADKLKC